MASVLEAFQGVQTITITNLNSLASSLTAGWGSGVIDNSTSLYTDFAFEVVLAAVNTAPGIFKGFYLFAYTTLNAASPAYTTTGATSGGVPGTEGALDLPGHFRQSGQPVAGEGHPDVGQNTAINAQFTVAAQTGGIIWPKFGIAMVNASGMTIAASGNSISYAGFYNTVA